MTMPKGWKITFSESSINENLIPDDLKLMRPMVPNSYLSSIYPLKKVEEVDLGTGEVRQIKNMKYLEFNPIEAKRCIVFNYSTSEKASELPLRNVTDIKPIDDDGLEISFRGTETMGGLNERSRIRVKPDPNYIDQLFESIKASKVIEKNTKYWSSESLIVRKADSTNKRIDVLCFTPYLADGEQIVWSKTQTRWINGIEKTRMIEAITNYRICQYDYERHTGNAFLFPALEEVKVTNRKQILATSPTGHYSFASKKLTGIDDVRTHEIIGDISLSSKDKMVVIFSKIVDPETLSKVIITLKDLYANLNNVQKNEVKRVRCDRCGNDVILNQSEFCNKCGSRLLNKNSLLITSLYLDSQFEAEQSNLTPEQYKLQRYKHLSQRIEDYKPSWDKNGVIQYKTEYIAILQRKWGFQIEFIIAFDDLTREGYRLMAVDEGKDWRRLFWWFYWRC